MYLRNVSMSFTLPARERARGGGEERREVRRQRGAGCEAQRDPNERRADGAWKGQGGRAIRIKGVRVHATGQGSARARTSRDGVSEVSVLVEGKVGLQDARREPGDAVRVEEAPVPVVGDAPAVLHLADHVVDHDPVDRPPLGLDVGEVILHKLHGRRQV